MAFKKGSEAIEESVKAEQAARASASGRLEYLTVESDDTVFLRFLTDAPEWIKVAQHAFAKTKTGPKDAKKWPKSMGAVCRYDSQIADMFNGCYICDAGVKSAYRDEPSRPSGKVWALAVMRASIKGDGSEDLGGPSMKGRVIGMGDVTEEYEILKDGKSTGKKGVRPKIVMVNQAWSNFFAPLHHAWTVNGTVCDRDYAVKKSGSGTDTTYSIMPLDKVPGLEPGTEAWKRFEQALKDREIDLDEIVMNQASDEWYAKWFDPSKSVDKDGKVVKNLADADAEVFSPTPDATGPLDADAEAKMRELQARLTASGSA